MATNFGNIANMAQLTGIDAVRLIGMIVQAASTARLHKKSCQQFAQHLKLIGNLLEQLKIGELKKYPESREVLDRLENALWRSYNLIISFQDRSYFYLLAMGWNIVNQFKNAQREIDGYLKIIPLITLVDNARARERLDYILKKHQYEYTLDDDDKKVQHLINKREPTKNDSAILKKSLSCSYPNLTINEAIEREIEKLQQELQRYKNNMDVARVIQHLIEVTESIATNSVQNKNCSNPGVSQKGHHNQENHTRNEVVSTSRNTLNLSKHEWYSDLLGCFSEPLLCLKTHFFPCGTFSRIATVANNRPTSSADACRELTAYSLVCSCCCYTSCIRRKVRKMLKIKGNWCDDFLSHLICCCCALVQEARELEIHGDVGTREVRTSHPTPQRMESKQ